jgi:hypothetical protein
MGRAAGHSAELVAAMSVWGSKRHFDRASHFRSSPMNRHRQYRSACLKRAKTRLMRCSKNPISLRSRPSYRRIKLDQWLSPIEQLPRRQHVRGVEPFGKPAVNRLKYLGGTGSIFPTNP